MSLELTLGLTLAALLFEAVFGYPGFLLARIGHPVMWIGRLIGWLDRHLNRDAAAPRERRMAGVGALVLIVLASGLAGLVVQRLLLGLPLGLLLAALAGSTLLAQRSLHVFVGAVADGLDESLEAGRGAVAHIVGRDPEKLDEAGVARAAIESLAENYSDGVVAPALWMAVGGLPGAAIYKAVNTADSMIGHRDARHTHFGWAAARFDDLINLPASRLAGGLIVVAAVFVRGASPWRAVTAIRADAARHRSPNAGWPEAAMAGALGIAIAGPRHYGGKLSVDGLMGAGGRYECTAADIRRALALYRAADAVMVALVAALALLAWGW
ncbi:cobalamin biosynthesis protein CobD [Ancylobacter dichloromethanicus]|uniref:Cobalamin biosynthesis protein CobD n=1 Tax=Ancylobacter dichloromethanicus TaxID=518825 RepID=A0A9W6N008_9HYPH|nr:adenosylcobinamide-phosphate synthase CbiB [Ancylobacter dichloromethanicus]MBS7553610.1 cobalamin biosynthesis protein CobD [Ancylobacter dichloromethanicus]GLK72673.1 cobalamin biosynthesis protein CobD [Ancylobacter dichloromethanicus]